MAYRIGVLNRILADTREDFQKCVARAKDDEARTLLDALQDRTMTTLHEILSKVSAGTIRPDLPLRLSSLDAPIRWSGDLEAGVQRVGFLATSGDPFYWGHIYLALSAIIELDLHTVVVQVMGDHPLKRGVKQAKEHRHAIARRALEAFFPLLRYTPLGFDNMKIGEENAAELLLLNHGLPLEVFYIAGGDVQEVAAANLQACRTLLIPRDGSRSPSLRGLLFPREEDPSVPSLRDDYGFVEIASRSPMTFPRVRGQPLSSTMFRTDPEIPILPILALEYVEQHGLYRGVRDYGRNLSPAAVLADTVIIGLSPCDVASLFTDAGELREVGRLVPNGPLVWNVSFGDKEVSLLSGAEAEIATLPVVRRPEVRTVLVLGACSGLQSSIAVGDVIVPSHAIRGSATMAYWLDPSIPATADFACVCAIQQALASEGMHVGPTYSTASQANETQMISVCGPVGVLAVESDLAKVFTLCQLHGKRAGAAFVVAGRVVPGRVSYAEGLDLGERLHSQLQRTLQALLRVAVGSG